MEIASWDTERALLPIRKKKILVLGLDSAPADAVFNKYLGELPNLKRLMDRGAWGTLWSCDPPITVPAWMVMLTSKLPGQLGIYGFRHRVNSSYSQVRVASSMTVKEPVVWDILGDRGDHVIVVAVPPSFPPRPVNGERVGCFLTPDTSAEYTYPRALKKEIEETIGEYMVDVTFRHENRDQVLSELWKMTEKRFDLFEHLLKTRDWDFFIGHEIGLDRLQHTFWKYSDPEHHLYEPGNKYENSMLDFYRMLDGRVGRIIDLVPEDTAVMVVSDHGAQRMTGAFCVNQWLERKGYLTFKTPPTAGMQVEKADIDWSRTKAWAWGGYYARIFINLQGREEQGIVPPDQYEMTLKELTADFNTIAGPNGEKWETDVFRPEERYGVAIGDVPDLMVYLDDLRWRAAGTLGHGSDFLLENDTGPDDAVHSREGIVVLANCGITGEIKDAQIQDIAPTILTVAGIEPPADMVGKSLV